MKSYILFFKTESQKDTRINYAREFNTVEEALEYRESLIRWGYNGEKVIKTVLKEGKI